jgi:hypothetical protein
MRATGRNSVSAILVALVTVAWYAIAAVLALTVVLVLTGARVAVQLEPDGAPNVDIDRGARMSIPVSLSIDAEALHVAAPSLGIDAAELQHVRGSLWFPARGPAGWLALGAVVLMLAVALWLLREMKGIFRTVRDGTPFVPANAARVRRIAFAVILGELARSAVVFWGNSYAAAHFSGHGLLFDARPDVNVFALVDGLIILALAEVFRAGTRLDEEQSLTV